MNKEKALKNQGLEFREDIVFDGGDTSVEDTWTTYVSDGNAILAEPEDYITLR